MWIVKHFLNTMKSERGDIGSAIGTGISLIGGLFGGDSGGSSTTTVKDPYKEAMMKLLMPEYQKLAPQLSGILQNKMSGTALPEDLAQTIGKYYGQAGEKTGNYFASNNMLGSGPAQQAFQGLTQEEIATKLSTLLGQQREGQNQALSFMGLGQQSSGTGTTTASVDEGIDWGSMGTLLSKLNFGSPSAVNTGAIGSNTLWDKLYGSTSFGGSSFKL